MPSSGQVKSIFFLILFLLSILGGILLASLLQQPAIAQSPSSDTVLNRYQIGQQTYLENCATCHIAIPPSILPSQTWKKILENPNSHYGIRLKPIVGITQRFIWDYLSYSSRPLTQTTFVPLLIEQSSYLKVLHPRVNLPNPIGHTTCVTCHPNASRYDYQTLTPIWDNAAQSVISFQMRIFSSLITDYCLLITEQPPLPVNLLRSGRVSLKILGVSKQ